MVAIGETGRKSGSPRDVRRMAGLERAATFLGGQEVLAGVLGIASRQLRNKFTADRPIHDADLRLAAAALVARAHQATDLAHRLTALIIEQGTDDDSAK